MTDGQGEGSSQPAAGTPGGAPGRCVLVLGMHRSGTSALTRVLSLMGAALPRNLLGAGPGNETGHWEPEPLVYYHDKLLAELGSRWDDWRALEMGALSAPRREEVKAEIAALLAAEYGGAPLFVVKDPRVCRFAPLFIEALGGAGIEARSVLVFRNPLEVAQSLESRDGMTLGQAALLWLRHVLEAEAATRGAPRAIAAYDALLADWRAALANLTSQLGVSWPMAAAGIAGEVEGFLSPARRHHARSTEDVRLDPALGGWIDESYSALLALERDPAARPALAALDRIRGEFDRAAPLLHRLQEEARAVSERRTSSLGAALHEARGQTEEMAARLAERDGEVADTARALAGAERGAAALTATLTAREEEAARLGAALSEAEDGAREMALALTASEEETARLGAALSEAEGGARELAVKLAGRDGEIAHLIQAAAERDGRIEALTQSVARSDGEIVSQRQAAAGRAGEIGGLTERLAEREKRIGALDKAAAVRESEIAGLRRRVAETEAQLDIIVKSNSWRVTWPLRSLRRNLLNHPYAVARGRLPRGARWFWRRLPLPMEGKQRLKNTLFRKLPFLFRSTQVYRNWRSLIEEERMLRGSREYGPIKKIISFNRRADPPNHLSGKICVHVHLYHLSMAGEFADVLNRLTLKFTILISISEQEDEKFWTAFFRERVSSANQVIVKRVINRGRDVLPWIVSFAAEIKKHEIFCHMHTKRSDHNKSLKPWRTFLAYNVFGSTSIVNQTLRLFAKDKKLGLIFPPYFGAIKSLPSWGENEANASKLLSRLAPGYTYGRCPDFPAGSFFWARVDCLRPLFELELNEEDFEREAGQCDGTLAHAIERIIGALPDITGMSKLCTAVDIEYQQVVSRESGTKVERQEYPDHVLPAPPTTKPHDSALAMGQCANPDLFSAEKIKIEGHLERLNHNVINGWVADLNNGDPRVVLITVDGKCVARATADQFRQDLKAAGYHQGKHGFCILAPPAYFDGRLHLVEVKDEATGCMFARKEATFVRRQRHRDFEGFLRDSLVNPEVDAPFREEDKRCWAVMEAIEKRLCNVASSHGPRSLFSIIMPAYNREGIIARSIQSILDQSYSNFELIVIDDASTDRTADVVRSFPDSRIRLIQKETRGGAPSARNAGIRAAKGEYLTYLDSDNTMSANFLMAFSGAFIELPEAEALYCAQALYRDKETIPYAIRYGSLNRALIENQNYIDLNVLAHKATLIEKVGLFDEEFQRFSDYDYILKIMEANSKVYSIPAILSNYYLRAADNTITSNSALMPLLERVREKRRERLKLAPSLNCSLSRPVTIIIPSYESLEDLRGCVASIHKTCANSKTSIVIVDNHSSSDVRDYLKDIDGHDGVRVLFNDVNYGFSHAVNQGLKLATEGDDILLLNNDALLFPGAIQALQQCAYSGERIAVSVPRQVLPSGTKTITTHVPFAFGDQDCDVNLSWHHNNIDFVQCFHDGTLVDLAFAPFFCVYIKRRVMDELGGLDAQFGRHYRSDRTFCSLVRQHLNMRIVYTPDAIVYHKLQVATDSLHKDASRRSEFESMFLRNQWPADLRQQLGFKEAIWDQA